ncbi:MAG: glycosyltransferase family 4 protein [Nitrospirales bacterium]|nr:glycosyltransferase family 4 protein [Nitrospira sp.]MDR4501894.1 glycosyltransferase family 4 protein [Nitrospirales bacterium]
MSQSEPIRILHIIDKLEIDGASIHGITQTLKWWIHCHDSSQFEATVCNLRARESGGKFLERSGISVVYLDKGKFAPSTLTDLMKLIRQLRPHVLHLHGYGSANFGRLASWLTGVPNIVHEHAVLIDQPFYQTIADTILSPLTTKAIAVSNSVKEFMHRRRKINPSRIDIRIVGLPLSELSQFDATSIAMKRSELGISEKETIVSVVGRLAEMKGQIYFIRAAAELIKTYPLTRFLIVGDGPDRELLEREAQRLKLGDRLFFTGFYEDVSIMFALSNIIVIPSINKEGGPLTLLEAMNSGKPVIGTPTGMMPDVIVEGETGYIVPPKDVSALVDKLSTLLGNPLLAKEMGEKGWKVCREYDVAYSSKHLEGIYKDLAMK